MDQKTSWESTYQKSLKDITTRLEKENYAKESREKLKSINKELKEAEEARKAVGPKIAVLHARGPIIDFNLGPGFASVLICRDDFVKVVDELHKLSRPVKGEMIGQVGTISANSDESVGSIIAGFC